MKQLSLRKKCIELLKKWQNKIEEYDANYQFGKCGADDMSMDHGRYEQLEECAAYLEIILETENNHAI